MERTWISCGVHFPRLELQGEVEEVEGAAVLKTLTGLRIATEAVSPEMEAQQAFCRLAVRPFPLSTPLPVSSENILLGMPSGADEWIVEGMESPLDRLLDLVAVYGWRLELQPQAGGWTTFILTLSADWEINTLPEILPGFSVGEARLTGRFHPNLEATLHTDKCAISIAWPFSLQGHLRLQNPQWTGTRWRANLDLLTLEGLIDGVGDALRDFPIARLGLKELTNYLPEDTPIEDWLFMDAFTSEDGFPGFAIELSTPESFVLAEFGGMKLLLIGRAAFVFEAVFNDESVALTFYLTFTSQTNSGAEFVGFQLQGPIIQKIEEFAADVRAVVSMLPVDGADQLPEIKFEYRLPDELTPDDIPLGDIQIPLNWQGIVQSNPRMDFLANLPLEVPQEALASLTGFQLGSIQGDSPGMMLKIESAESFTRGTERGLALTIRLAFTIFDEVLELECYWEMALDTAVLAFDPARHISITILTEELRFGDLIIDGLDTLEASWGSNGLVLQASELRAYYVGLSEPGDTASGFELRVENLVFDSGGVAMKATLTGGASKIDGIGETFSGASGSVEIVASKVVSAEFIVSGALPILDNATGTMQLIFGKGLKLMEANAEFQLGLHKKTDWWVEFALDQLKLKVDTSSSKTRIVVLITGMIAFKPPSNSGNALLSWFKLVEISFTDLVLTSAFDRIPPGFRLFIELDKPRTFDFLGVFQYELRSVGLSTGFDPGQAALTLGGQIFFSSGDKEDPDPGLHILRIGQPEPGKWVPRVRLSRLPLNMSIGATLRLRGFVEFIDEPGYRGFKGRAELQIEGSLGFAVLVEISKVRRESDKKDLRVWMVYIEVQEINAPLVLGFYLRDVGLGFGWRKTLQIMDNPKAILDDPTKTGLSIGPHRPESWVNYLEGDSAYWTVVLSAWITLGLGARNAPMPIVGDFIFALRSDLTIVALMRGWVFDTLQRLKSQGGNPPMKGLLYYSARKKHFIAAYVVNPALAAPQGIPPVLVQSLLGPPFNFNLETRPGYLHFDLGWPRQLQFPLAPPYTGWAGIFFRKQPGSVTIGVGFEIGILKEYSYGIGFGIASLSIGIYIRIGIYGMVAVRIGNLPAMYGVVGINAVVRISLSLRVSFKIKFIKIRFSISFSLELIIAARIEFGVTEKGFGIAGHASASLRIWKFSFSASISFVINGNKLEEARNRINDGANYFGPGPAHIPGNRRIPLLPELGQQLPEPVPVITPDEARWRALYIIAPDRSKLYVLLLPDEHSHFPTPDLLLEEEGQENPYVERIEPDIHAVFSGQNIHPVNAAEAPQYNLNRHIAWNSEIPAENQTNEQLPDDEATIKIGDLFYESPELREERALIHHNTTLNQPELLEDPRVRQAAGVSASETEDFGVRPDVRSPKFTATNSLYDAALETAAKNEAAEILSWEQIALAFSGWENEALNKDLVRDALPEDFDPDTPPTDPIALDYWRKQWLDTAEMLKTGQSGVIERLLREFRLWSRNGQPLENYPLLTASGLASEWNIPNPQAPFSLSLETLTVYQGSGISQTLQALSNQFEPANITQEDVGLGFARQGWDYKVRDIYEFQDRQGIYFSWELEARDGDSNIFVMDHHLSSGIGTETALADFDVFEFFDTFKVVRTNLSKNEDPEASSKVWEVKPAYLPALQDMGSGVKKFFLLVPRFSFSDVFSGAGEEEGTDVDVGDELLYRISALDVFGNESQATELLVSRKNLEPPPAPTEVALEYKVQLAETAQEWLEQAQLTITTSEQAATWEGTLSYALFARQRSLEPGGFFGRGAGLDTAPEEQEGVPEHTDGLLRLWEGETLEYMLDANWTNRLPYGYGYELFVQSVSEEGNRSALVRVMVNTMLTDAEGKEQQFTLAYLERVPPPENYAQQWLGREHMRSEAAIAESPVFSGDDTQPVAHVMASDHRFRTVYLRFAYQASLDAIGHHPAGGYHLEVRDRDATRSDDPNAYRSLAEVEAVSRDFYLSNPSTTTEAMAWKSNFIPVGGISAADELINEQALEESRPPEERQWPGVIADWGTPMQLVPSVPEDELLPAEHWWHPVLLELMSALAEELRKQGYEWEYAAGPPTSSQLKNITTDQLATWFSKEDDPDGLRLLKWLGRSIEGTILKDQESVTHAELKAIINNSIQQTSVGINWEEFPVTVEVLLHGDKNTQIHLVRISLPPRLSLIKTATSVGLENAIQEETEKWITVLNAQVQVVGAYAIPGLDAAEVMLAEWLQKLKSTFAVHVAGPQLISGVTHFLDLGQYQRPVQRDGAILIGLPYTESYARRYTYRLKQYSRYYYVYEEFGIPLPVLTFDEDTQGLPIRLPRVKPLESPVVIYLGNHWRDDVLCSEWLLPVHEEEIRVQANETMRNRLGFRSLAWTLYCDLKTGLAESSGWEGEVTWWNRSVIPADGGDPGLSDEEKALLASDASKPEAAPSSHVPSLSGHPFTDLLTPKGLVVRIPQLPFYYTYQLAAFARADDLDSTVTLNDAATVFPAVMATVREDTAGWHLDTQDGEPSIVFWWRVPSVWDSLSPEEQALWVREQPLASRLWDYDLRFRIYVERNALRKGLVELKANSLSEDDEPSTSRSYEINTLGQDLFWNAPGRFEKRNEILFPSIFHPEIRLEFRISEALYQALLVEKRFPFRLECFRTYGTHRQSWTNLYPPLTPSDL